MRFPRGPRALAALARALAPPRCWRPAALLSSLCRGSCGFDFFPFHSYQTKIKCFRRQKLFKDILGPLDFWSWKCSYWPGYVRVQPCTHAPMHSSAVAGDRQPGLGRPALVRLAVGWVQLHRCLRLGAFEKLRIRWCLTGAQSRGPQVFLLRSWIPLPASLGRCPTFLYIFVCPHGYP